MSYARAGFMVALIGLTACGAAAQTHLGQSPNVGLHWAVHAPSGTIWSLSCRFRPITYARNLYDQKHWANRLRRSGSGSQQGRLPSDNGNCRLNLIDGSGPVGLAVVKNGQPTKSGTTHKDRAAIVNVF